MEATLSNGKIHADVSMIKDRVVMISAYQIDYDETPKYDALIDLKTGIIVTNNIGQYLLAIAHEEQGA